MKKIRKEQGGFIHGLKKLFLVGLTAITISLFVTSAFAQGGNGNGRGSKSGSRGTGTCPRITQSINQKDASCFRSSKRDNRPNRGNGANRPNNPNRQRVMDPTNPNCPYCRY